MEIKKLAPTPVKEAGRNAQSVQVGHFIEELKSEFSRISWTSPDELKVYTKIVVATTFFFGMGIYATDLVIQGVLGGLGVLLRLFGG